MFKELRLFPSRKQKVPSLIYSKEELEQQLKESARLKRYLRKTGLYEFESIPHDIFDVLRSDLSQHALQNKPGELALNPVTHISAQNNSLDRVVNNQLQVDINEYRAKRRKLMESGKAQETRQDQQNVEPVVPSTLNQTVITTGQAANETAQEQVRSSETATATPAAAVTSNTSTTITPVAPVTTATVTQPPVINTTNVTLETWYSPTETVAFPTYIYPTCWVPVFANHTQISYCEAQSSVISDSAPQYNLAFDKTLEYLNYPMNRELVIDEETIAEIWSSSEKLKIIKGLLDALTKEDYCIAILTLDMDGESHLLELLQVTGYECDRISNVVVDDWDYDYGVVLWTDKSKQNEPFNGDVDTAFVMDSRVLKKKNITGLRARSESNEEKIRLCYFVTIGSVEERALKSILQNKNMTDADLRKAVLAENEWPYEHDGNRAVLYNLLSWLRRNSNMEYTYRAKHKLPGSTRVEASPLAGEITAPSSSPMVVDSEPASTLISTPVSTPVSVPTTTTATTIVATPVAPAIPAATVETENAGVSDMDVSSDEEGRIVESVQTLPKYIESYIGNFLPRYIVNKVRVTFDDQQATAITEREKSVRDNLEKETLQTYLRLANEAKERFEKEIEELREKYKKVALDRSKEMYH